VTGVQVFEGDGVDRRVTHPPHPPIFLVEGLDTGFPFDPDRTEIEVVNLDLQTNKLHMRLTGDQTELYAPLRLWREGGKPLKVTYRLRESGYVTSSFTATLLMLGQEGRGDVQILELWMHLHPVAASS
jgi:hypothetical protein